MMGRKQVLNGDEEEFIYCRGRCNCYHNRPKKGRLIKQKVNKRYRQEQKKLLNEQGE